LGELPIADSGNEYRRHLHALARRRHTHEWPRMVRGPSRSHDHPVPFRDQGVHLDSRVGEGGAQDGDRLLDAGGPVRDAAGGKGQNAGLSTEYHTDTMQDLGEVLQAGAKEAAARADLSVRSAGSGMPTGRSAAPQPGEGTKPGRSNLAD
jgi:hypothetical protein